MTRYIAILTLALTAALSVDQAFASDVTQDTYIIKNFSEPNVNEALAAEAIFAIMIEFEYEYVMLRKEGFTDQEARGVVLLVLHALHADTDELGIVIAIIADGGSEDLDCDGEYILGQANGKVAPSKHVLGQANGKVAPSNYVLGQATGVGQSVY